LRLKELCANGALIKRQHAYELNGASGFESLAVGSAKGLSGVFRNRRVKNGFMLIMLVICFSASGFVMAKLFSQPSSNKEVIPAPVVIGNFTMALNVSDIYDLYTWQVAINYDPNQLKVLEVTVGDFLGEDVVFLYSTDSSPDLLLLGGTLKGTAGLSGSGKSGSGRLATVVFGYFTENYDEPEIVPKNVFETELQNSQGSIIPIKESTLTLSPVK
jgi:hypothetical protein